MTTSSRDRDHDGVPARGTQQSEPFAHRLRRHEAMQVLHVWQPTWGELAKLQKQDSAGSQNMRVWLVSRVLTEMHKRRLPKTPAEIESARQALQLFGPPGWVDPPTWVAEVRTETIQGWVQVLAWSLDAAQAKLLATLPGIATAPRPDPGSPMGRRMAEALRLYPGDDR
jgi:hypothetical protein